MHIIIPNWTVNFAINWLLQQAQGIDSKSGLQDSYFFFQTANGGYRIQNISEMMGVQYLGFSDKEKLFPTTFYYAPASGKDKIEDWDESPPENPRVGPGRRILDYTIGSSANVLEGIIEGLFGQKQITIDTIDKLYIESYYDYHSSFNSSKNIEGHPLVREEKEKIWIGNTAGPDDSKVETYPYMMRDPETISSYPDAHTTLTSNSSFVNDEDNKIHHVNQNTHLGGVQTRTALRQLLKYYTMNILLPTRTDISVGQVIDLELPPTIGLPDLPRKIKPALFHSGKYLITDIKWGLTTEGCRTNVKVIKDSLMNDISSVPIEYPPTIKKSEESL